MWSSLRPRGLHGGGGACPACARVVYSRVRVWSSLRPRGLHGGGGACPACARVVYSRVRVWSSLRPRGLHGGGGACPACARRRRARAVRGRRRAEPDVHRRPPDEAIQRAVRRVHQQARSARSEPGARARTAAVRGGVAPRGRGGIALVGWGAVSVRVGGRSHREGQGRASPGSSNVSIYQLSVFGTVICCNSKSRW